MSLAIYPSYTRGLTFSVLKKMEFFTQTKSSANRYSNRVAQSRNPIWHWSLIYDWLQDDPSDIQTGLIYSDLRTLQGFFGSRYGGFDDFLFNDPSDNYVGPALVAGPSPNQAARLYLLTDGLGHYYTPIQRPLGGLTATWNDQSRFFEDVTDLQPAGGNDHSHFKVYANGVLQTFGSDYTIAGPGLAIPGFGFSGLYVLWNGTPTEPITAEFNFYFRAAFDMDDADFEKVLGSLTPAAIDNPSQTGIWTIGGSLGKSGKGQITLVSSRTPTV